MGAASILTVDLGNSGGSAALVLTDEGGRFGIDPISSWPRGEGEVAAIEAAGQVAIQRARCGRAAVSAVGSLDREAAAVGGLSGIGLGVIARPDAGLTMRIDHPETCGSDRQYAVRGALALALGEWRRGMASAPSVVPGVRILVVDAGTALTVDAARADGSGGTLEFLGGAIALGPGELQRAITGAGARLPEFDLDGDVPALGRSTHGALRSGAVVGFRGAVRELCASIGREAFSAEGSPGAQSTTFGVHLTGGARSFAQPVLDDLYGTRLHVDPLLVHRGLAIAALGHGD